MKKLISNIPCKDCITFIMCKNIYHSPSSNSKMLHEKRRLLMNRCSILRQYFTLGINHEIHSDRTNDFHDIFNPHKTKN